MSAKRSPTLKEVATLAGVSIATASFALNGTRTVGKEVMVRVVAAADELGYRPNVLARGLKTGHSRLVTCIVSSLSNPLIAAAVEGVHAVLDRNGFGMLIYRSGPRSQDVSAGVEFAASYHSAGLLVFHPEATYSTHLQRWLLAARPVTFAIHAPKRLNADLVLMADEDAGYTATQHLLEHGHTSIGLIIRSRSLDVYASIVAGYCRALADAGMSTVGELIRGGSANALRSTAQELGRTETLSLLNLKNAPTAILCAHNQIAVGSLQALQSRQIAIPECMSLVSFDRVDWMDVTAPKVTSIGIDGVLIGKTAAENLLSRIENGPGERQISSLQLQLYPGASVGRRHRCLDS